MAVKDNNSKASASPTSAQRGAKIRRQEDDGPVYTGTALSMSGIRGLVQNSLLWKVVMGLLIFIFAVGFAITAIAPKSSPDGRPASGSGPSRVASVGNQTVERDEYLQAASAQIEQMERFGMKTDAMGLLGSHQRTLDELISQAAQYDDAVAKGMVPSDSEINAEIDKRIAEQTKQAQSKNPAVFRRQVEAQFGSMAEFEKKVRENFEKNRDLLSRDMAVERLKKSVQDKNKTTEADYKKSVTKFDFYQITVRPKPEPVTPGKDAKSLEEKSKADAQVRAEKLGASLKNADLATFKKTALKESDDFASKSKGGSIGWKLVSELPVAQPVKDALTAATGKVVGPVQDEYAGGAWQIFFINGQKEELPKDYAKKKSDTLKAFETAEDDKAWNKYVDDLKKQKTPEIFDPAIQAFKIQNEKLFTVPADQQKTLREEALAKYQEALGYSAPDEAAAIHYQMSQLYRQGGQNDKALSALEAAVKESGDTNLRVQLASALHEAKRDKEALDQLKQASKRLDDSPSPPSMFGGNPDDGVRAQIASTYEMMGKKDLAAAERKKIKAPAGGMGGMGGGMPFSIQPR